MQKGKTFEELNLSNEYKGLTTNDIYKKSIVLYKEFVSKGEHIEKEEKEILKVH